MPNVVFVAPYFLETTLRFVQGAAQSAPAVSTPIAASLEKRIFCTPLDGR